MRKVACPMVAAIALLVCACAVKLHPYELDDAHVGAPGVERVGLLPLNVLRPLPPELDVATRRVRDAIRVHLERCSVEVESFTVGEARRLWSQASEGISSDDAEARRRYVELLRAKRDFDVLVTPSLVYREARIRSVTRAVDWDGVSRTLEVKGYVHAYGSMAMMLEVHGKMPAVSLHLAVLDGTGRAVFDSYAGLDVVHAADVGTDGRVDLENRPAQRTWQFVLKRDRLSNPQFIREGVALAFVPYLEPRPPRTPATDAAP